MRRRVHFADTVAEADSAEAREGLAWACWWLEDGDGSIEAREDAYRLFKEAGDLRGAVRAEEAVAQGWFARGERILVELGRTLGLTSLEMLGLATEGLAMVSEGET